MLLRQTAVVDSTGLLVAILIKPSSDRAGYCDMVEEQQQLFSILLLANAGCIPSSYLCSITAPTQKHDVSTIALLAFDPLQNQDQAAFLQAVSPEV